MRVLVSRVYRYLMYIYFLMRKTWKIGRESLRNAHVHIDRQ